MIYRNGQSAPEFAPDVKTQNLFKLLWSLNNCYLEALTYVFLLQNPTQDRMHLFLKGSIALQIFYNIMTETKEENAKSINWICMDLLHALYFQRNDVFKMHMEKYLGGGGTQLNKKCKADIKSFLQGFQVEKPKKSTLAKSLLLFEDILDSEKNAISPENTEVRFIWEEMPNKNDSAPRHMYLPALSKNGMDGFDIYRSLGNLLLIAKGSSFIPKDSEEAENVLDYGSPSCSCVSASLPITGVL